MRVLFVTNRYPTDKTPGSSPCIEQQGIAIQKLGYNLDVLFIESEQSKLSYLKAIWRIFWAVQIKKQYDLIHAHYGSYCSIVARMQFRAPVVVTFRGSDILLKNERVISRLVAKFVNKAIVMTEDMKRLSGRNDAYVIPYGINLDLFRPCLLAKARQELELPLEPPLILFPYDPKRPLKRFDLVEQAIMLLKGEFPDIQVLAIHDKPPEVVVTYMSACDAMVLASDSEGAPVAIREAMACNLPIVSVDVGDVVKIIQDIEGCYIAKRTSEDIAEKLAQVLRTRKRTKGRLAAQRMSISQSATEIAAIYESLLRKGQAVRHINVNLP